VLGQLVAHSLDLGALLGAEEGEGLRAYALGDLEHLGRVGERDAPPIGALLLAVLLYYEFEVLEEVREAGSFTFDAVEYRGPKG
jgi:hypothetical protein